MILWIPFCYDWPTQWYRLVGLKMTLYEILKAQFKTNAAIGRRFPKKGKARGSQGVGKWKTRGVPEDVAILCHLDPSIPYIHPDLAHTEEGQGKQSEV